MRASIYAINSNKGNEKNREHRVEHTEEPECQGTGPRKAAGPSSFSAPRAEAQRLPENLETRRAKNAAGNAGGMSAKGLGSNRRPLSKVSRSQRARAGGAKRISSIGRGIENVRLPVGGMFGNKFSHSGERSEAERGVREGEVGRVQSKRRRAASVAASDLARNRR